MVDYLTLFVQSIQVSVIALILIYLIVVGFKVVRPTERGLIERLGKYSRFSQSGLSYVVPILEKIYRVNVTEKMNTVDTQEIITKDKLNATVAAQIYYKVKEDETSVKASQYNVYNVDKQIVALAQTTLRNIIGTMTLTEANSDRSKINSDLMATLSKETKNWGIEVVRTELREINPPKDVQETMNNVVKAENTKTAATDYATAAETEADGKRRAAIKLAEGQKQSAILTAEGLKEALIREAEGKAQSIKLVNEAGDKYFVGNAQLLRQLEVAENALRTNTVYVIPEGQSLVTVLNGLAGGTVIPVEKKKGTN